MPEKIGVTAAKLNTFIAIVVIAIIIVVLVALLVMPTTDMRHAEGFAYHAVANRGSSRAFRM